MSHRIHWNWIPSHVVIEGNELQKPWLKRVLVMPRYFLHLFENEISILFDSRSFIQYLANSYRLRDNVGVIILEMLNQLSFSNRIHWKWIPFHVHIEGNTLAKEGSYDVSVPSASLTYLELFSWEKCKDKIIWIVVP